MLTRGHHRGGSGLDTIRAFFILLSFTPACSPKIIETVRTETVIEYRDSVVLRDTTIYVPIPLEADQAIVHVGDTSHRETTVAESDAWVGADGLLHHNLRNKPGTLPCPVTIPEHFLTTTVTNTKESAGTIVKEVQVEKPLTLWQKTRIRAFWPLLVLVIGLLVWTIRKPLVKLIQKMWLPV